MRKDREAEDNDRSVTRRRQMIRIRRKRRKRRSIRGRS